MLVKLTLLPLKQEIRKPIGEKRTKEYQRDDIIKGICINDYPDIGICLGRTIMQKIY